MRKKTSIVFHADSDGCTAAAMIYSRFVHQVQSTNDPATNESVVTPVETRAEKTTETPAEQTAKKRAAKPVAKDFVHLVPVMSADSVGAVIRASCPSRNDAFILDLGAVRQEDVDHFEGAVLVIDHHVVPFSSPLKNCVHINPRMDGSPPHPASLLVFDLLGRPERLDWIAAIGVVGDWGAKMAGDLLTLVREKYADFAQHERQEELYFTDRVGMMARGIDAVRSIQGSGGIIRVVECLAECESPSQFWTDCEGVRDAFEIVERQVERLRGTAKKSEDESGGGGGASIVTLRIPAGSVDFEIKRELAQRLVFENPKSLIVVVVQERSDGSAAFSLRQGKDFAQKLDLNETAKTATKGLPGAGGGGHPEAAGGHLHSRDVDKFLGRIRKKVRGMTTS